MKNVTSSGENTVKEINISILLEKIRPGDFVLESSEARRWGWLNLDE